MRFRREFDEEKILILDKGKRGLFRVVFGRTAIILGLLLIQVLCIIGVGSIWLQEYMGYFYIGYLILLILVVQYIINENSIPEMKLSWAILVLAVPVIGVPLFLIVKFQVGNRLLNGKLQKILTDTNHYARQDSEVKKILAKENVSFTGMASYLRRNGSFPVCSNTKVRYFPVGEDMFASLLEDIKKAKKFIFLEYFIVQEGYMWGRILNILQQKVREGVEVRLIYDGMCSLSLLPHNYPRKLAALGIDCKVFSPIRPVISTHYNNRDHRKILSIDGQIAYTGGVNLADEYINRKVRFGHWKDAAIRMEGDAARSFTLMFLQMWAVDSSKLEDFSPYLDVEYEKVEGAQGFVIPYCDSPLDAEQVGESVYIDMISHATESVHIMTPYLILDERMLYAITYAAKRGVDVALVLPHIPDKPTAFALAHSHYPELIRAGVKIYEYKPGFVHSKVVICDEKCAVVGTINFDFRSLYLHFECAAFLYGMDEISKIEEDFQETKGKSIQIHLKDCSKDSFWRRMEGRFLKLVAPLM